MKKLFGTVWVLVLALSLSLALAGTLPGPSGLNSGAAGWDPFMDLTTFNCMLMHTEGTFDPQALEPDSLLKSLGDLPLGFGIRDKKKRQTLKCSTIRDYRNRLNMFLKIVSF
jgi:hypothetical protein